MHVSHGYKDHLAIDGSTSYYAQGYAVLNNVDLIIFACLNFREFLIRGFFTKFRILEFYYFY